VNRKQYTLPEELMTPAQAAHTLRVMGGDKIRRGLALEIAAVIDRLAARDDRSKRPVLAAPAAPTP
jgi:hypothetical protein